MGILSLNGEKFTEMLIAGAANLSRHVEKVNALNVFPVPDGDTGTNMNLTMSSGVNELIKQPVQHAGKAAKIFSKGLLMGARGNSGVILSQLFRGLSKSLADAEEISSEQLATALSQGVVAAYSAVIKPVEGTILTVAKDAALGAQNAAKSTDDIAEMIQATITTAEVSLSRTPELLPILKEVGVVDSGGQGLVYIYTGFLQALQGNATRENLVPIKREQVLDNDVHFERAQLHLNTEDIVFGYCTEFLIHLNDTTDFDLTKVKGQLEAYGDSLVVVADEELVKIHVHTEKPGEILNLGQSFGELSGIKIENMREQHSHILQSEERMEVKETSRVSPTSAEKRYPFGIVAVSMGEGISRILKGIGAQEVVTGGQTMNPSTEDLLTAASHIPAEQIIFLPNNKNIVMAAEQAAAMLDVPAYVVPSRSIPQGISSLLAFDANASIEDNLEEMKEALSRVKTGQVTISVRDTKWDELEIKTGDFLGLIEGEIKNSGQTLAETALRLLSLLIKPEDEVLTILFGQEVDQDEVDELRKHVEEAYPQLEIDVHFGGQPLYPYIFSVE